MSKILVIEDETLVRDNIQDILILEGFDCLTAEHGEIGVQLAKTYRPDLIICDVMMPQLDGYGVLKALRQDIQTAAIPLIFLTAKTSWKDLRQGMELGADDYLAKPFTPDDLLKSIRMRLKKQAIACGFYSQQIEQLEAQLEHLVHHDDSTQFLNLSGLRHSFDQLTAELDWHETTMPLLRLSLDQFSWVGGVVGYDFGEILIKKVAERLNRLHWEGSQDVEAIAHLERGQFALLHKPTRNPSAIANTAKALLKALAAPLMIDQHEMFVTGSIGIAIGTSPQDSLNDLLVRASLAMNRAREQGGNQYQFYVPTEEIDPQEQLMLAAGLRHALERDEFRLFYQPQVDLNTGKITGMEALLRWFHPTWGMISPVKFIPLAEKTGMILPIEEWVLRTACAQASAWQHQLGLSLRMAVNLSARQFVQANLCQKVLQVLQETRLDPASLDLEITESVLMQDTETAVQILQAFRGSGVQVSIDDFGVGYSSLSYLQRFPFDTLKIDRSFVRNITSNLGNLAITTAIIQMAHSLGLHIVGEGVETKIELNFLRQQRCHTMQGYLFSPPVAAEELEQLLREDKHLVL